jgi:RNA polymerase sigma-70 factor (ECF subfamily)
MLFEQHGKAVLAYATRLSGNPAAAEDVLQETLILAWKHPEVPVSTKGLIRVWLCTLTRDLVVDRAERPREERDHEDDGVTVRTLHRDHSDIFVDDAVIMHALDALSEQYRDVLVEIYFRDRTITETARILGLRPGTVKSVPSTPFRGFEM